MRAWVWLAEVQWTAACSLTALDRKLLGEEHDGLRLFWRVSNNGYDPARPKVKLKNQNLVKLVSKRPGFGYTKDVYRHLLWRVVLGPSDISVDGQDQLISKLMHRLRVFQPDGTDSFICQELLGRPLLQARAAEDFRQALGALSKKRSLDAIMLMCLMYRRAISNAKLEEAICLREEIFLAVGHYCDRPYFSGRLKSFILHLINRRVFCGVRDLEPSSKAIERARLLISVRRERAKTPKALKIVEELEYEAAIHFSIFDREAQFYPLVWIDESVSAYLAARAELFERSGALAIERRVREAEMAINATSIDIPDC